MISSHLLAMIEDVCTHLLVMQQGRTHYFGSATELRRQHPGAKTLEQAYFAATQTDDQASPAASGDSALPLDRLPALRLSGLGNRQEGVS
jgi:ABC-2 type transport system ATP-binding protein